MNQLLNLMRMRHHATVRMVLSIVSLPLWLLIGLKIAEVLT